MFSIIMPFDFDRLPLLIKTLNRYKELGVPKDTEFILVTRMTDTEQLFGHLVGGLNYRIIQYTWNEKTFNPSMAFNLGVKEAVHSNIIITCPEIMPISNVLKQLSELSGRNILCQVYDEDSNGNMSMSLVNSHFRSEHPGMYFLAMFQRDDLYKINGWDEEFMHFYAHEDVDFGERFSRAGLIFEMHDEIQARHQYHPRGDGSSPEFSKGLEHLLQNNANKIIRPKRGLVYE